MTDHHQPQPETPFWLVVLLADELHLSHADARTHARNELCERTPPVLRKGYYRTKGGYHARIDVDIASGSSKIAAVSTIGYVAYLATGEFAYKDEFKSEFPELDQGDSLDLLLETWQAQPFQEQAKPQEVEKPLEIKP